MKRILTVDEIIFNEKTKPEPLKGKTEKWFLPNHTDNPIDIKAWVIRTENIKKDIKSAVEWLKEEIKILDQKWGMEDLSHVEFSNKLDITINEAFQGVMKK